MSTETNGPGSDPRNTEEQPQLTKAALERAAFFGERVVISTNIEGHHRKQMAGKTLWYEHPDAAMGSTPQKGMKETAARCREGSG